MTKPELSLETANTLVIKTGSALIVDTDTGELRQAWLSSFASDLARMRARGQRILLVTSGAIALGRDAMGLKPGEGRLEERQAAAGIGQIRLMSSLSEAFAPSGNKVAQALLTLEDTEARRRWLNARATLNTLLNNGIIPVVNENDTVATDEIRYGDNDRLAGRVAQMIGADMLVLLSDTDGLYTADPNTDKDAKFIERVDALTPQIHAMAGGANQDAQVGTGGMVTKLAAAEIAYGAGCTTIISRGSAPAPLAAIEEGARATWIVPNTSPISARQAWLHGHLNPQGFIHVDDGAEKALMTGASLLPIGIKAVEGDFPPGAAIAILAPNGETIAKGVSAYSAEDISLIKGHHSREVPRRLGYPARAAVVHRDDMVLIAITSA